MFNETDALEVLRKFLEGKRQEWVGDPKVTGPVGEGDRKCYTIQIERREMLPVYVDALPPSSNHTDTRSYYVYKDRVSPLGEG